jgi:hypothetical protein
MLASTVSAPTPRCWIDVYAAAGTGDVAQLHDAWQQLCACLGGEDDAELLAQYERLVRELGAGAARRSASRSGSEVGARG